MFDKEEVLILKELVEIEIIEVEKMINNSQDTDKEELIKHKGKLVSILKKFLTN